MQRIWPGLPRHRRTGLRIPDLPQWQGDTGIRHKWRDARAFLPLPPSVFLRPLGTQRLTLLILQVVAGVISLVNDFLISNDRAPLGFLNPWLYGSGFRGLNDITDGWNPGCKTDGFYAMEGWDPVSSTKPAFTFDVWMTLVSVGHGSRDALP